VLPKDLLDLPNYVKKDKEWKNIDIIMEDEVIIEAKIDGKITDEFDDKCLNSKTQITKEKDGSY